LKKIDHIVYAVQNLDAAMIAFEKKFGVRPIFGGVHKSFGTQNALINLGDNCYFELLAADETNSLVSNPRWMGIDVLQENKITRWAVTNVKKVNPEMGELAEGSRLTSDGKLLQWNLLMPTALPEVELLPFIIDWSKSDNHPTAMLPDMGCRLIELYGTHPAPNLLKTTLADLGVHLRINQFDKIQLKAIIESPNGRFEI